MNDREVARASWRLGVQTGLLVLACLLVVGAAIFFTFERSARSDAEQELRDVTAHVDRPREAPKDVLVVVTSGGSRQESPAMPGWMPDERALSATAGDGRVREEETTRHGHDYLIRTQRVGDRVTQAVLDYEAIERERSRVLVSLLEAGGVGVVLAALVAVWLSRGAFRPMAEALAMQRRFVADASHELRTPVTLLSTRVQLLARALRRRRVDGAEPEIAGVLADTERLGGILDDLLIASDTRRTLTYETVDLSLLVAEVVSSVEATAEEKGLLLDVERGPGCQVDGAEASLRRAVVALLDNALDHAVRKVAVSVARSGRRVRVEVADDGPGVPPELAPRLFDRFASARDGHDDPAQHAPRHYGIGLSLVADVAAAHGGAVSLAPTDPGTGATLLLDLPARGR